MIGQSLTVYCMKEKNKYSIRKSENKELLKKLHDIIFPSDIWCGFKNSVAWVVWYKKQPVGFCMMSTSNSAFGYYTRAGLKKKHFGKGLHKRMINVREKYARIIGYKKVITYTMPDNITSISNLQKRKYLIYEPVFKYAGKGCIYWQKEL